MITDGGDAALKVFETGKGPKADTFECSAERRILHEVAVMEKEYDTRLQIAHWRHDIYGVECPKLMLEFIPGSNMEHISLRALPFSSLIGFVLTMMKQIDIVLQSLHLFNIYHNDIKPANIIYDTEKNLFVLIDFGLAVPLSLLHRSKFRDIGFWTTITFMSPYHFDLVKNRKGELCDDERTRKKAAFADYYSLGLTAIRLIGRNCVRKYTIYSLCVMARTIMDVQQNYTKQDEIEYPEWSMERIRQKLMPFWCVVQQQVMTEVKKPPSEIENAAEFVSTLAEWMALSPEYFTYSNNQFVYHGSSVDDEEVIYIEDD